MDTPFPPAPSIQRENSTCGYNLQPTEVAQIANSIKDGVAPTRNIGLMLATKRRTGQSPESIVVATKLWFPNIVVD